MWRLSGHLQDSGGGLQGMNNRRSLPGRGLGTFYFTEDDTMHANSKLYMCSSMLSLKVLFML